MGPARWHKRWPRRREGEGAGASTGTWSALVVVVPDGRGGASLSWVPYAALGPPRFDPDVILGRDARVIEALRRGARGVTAARSVGTVAA